MSFPIVALSPPPVAFPCFFFFFRHQAAVDQLEVELQQDGNGAVVEYTHLPDILTEYIYPVHFGMGNDKLEEHLPYLSEAAG